MKQRFDLVVIGTGAAGSTVATNCRVAGWKVAIVDSRPFGGTCALRGCDPKKVLVDAAEIIDWARRMEGKGVRAERLGIDWQQLMRFKRSFTEPVPGQREEQFSKLGIATFHGRARFLAATTIQVGDDLLEGGHVVIAAGQRPADLKLPGAEHLTTSDQFLELDSLPRRIVFIGGGYIGFEFAHIAARSGSTVSILHRGTRPLPRFDPDLVDQLVARTRELGIAVHLGTQAEAIEQIDGHFSVRTSASEQRGTIEADMVVHSAGRVPEIDDLNLAAAGVQWDNRGIAVNEFLQSVSNPAIYAAGDAAASGGTPLTPMASYEGSIVAANLLNGNGKTPNYLGIPTVVFAIPPLASAGLSEIQARQQGLRFGVHHEATSSWYSSRRVGETHSGFKVLIEEGTERILGAHLLGADAEEVINLFALAIRSGITAAQLKQTIFSYPTHGSNLPYML